MVNRRVTISDVAQNAGCSVSTVSAVLRGNWQARRISPDTARRVEAAASEMGFLPNRQAQSLRGSRTGMIGMILPMHDNRFFSAISQAFEQKARARGLFPVVVSALREPNLEIDAARYLLSYRIDTLFVVGATASDAVADLARAQGVGVVHLGLPGRKAPSVVSDNAAGCQMLTDIAMRGLPTPPRHAVFLGGRGGDFTTTQRLRGFHAALDAAAPDARRTTITEGYGAGKAEAAISRVFAQDGPPSLLIVNSTISFEGVARYLRGHGAAALGDSVIGVFDWDPFGAILDLPIVMLRQRGDILVHHAFRLADEAHGSATRITVPCEMVRTPLLEDLHRRGLWS